MAKVDALVVEHRDATDYKLPGLTIAVTRRGRLLLTAGHGYADVEHKKPMQPGLRTLIGSVTKACITGPTAFKLLAAKKDASSHKLYGATGVLGLGFDADMKLAARRYTPIVAIALDAEDRTVAWYTDGTVSVGTSADLDARAKPQTFALPPGKRPVDIRSIAFDSKGRAHVWYDDGLHTIGTSTELDAYLKIPELPEDRVPVVFPRGRSMLGVVGIGIAKSNDHVYVWYDDAKVSSGTTTDFSLYSKPQPFDPGAGKQAHEIRDVEIGTNNHVYAWFADGEVSVGMSDKLDRYHGAYKYTWPSRPAGPDWQSWYSQITLQNLLDHKAGFTREGDDDAAARMFGVDADDVTYEQIHRHFLRTRKLLEAPGTISHYSNHSFGLWTLIIPQLTGESYKDCAEELHLGPLGLKDDVVPQTGVNGPADSLDYDFDTDLHVVLVKRGPSTVGLAAGGWRACAESLARIMVSLDGKYSDTELDSMGWRVGVRGNLAHGGSLSGGIAFVTMYPEGYTSTGGVNLGGIHVALAANGQGSSKDLESLAGHIALAVAEAGVPPTYNLWQLHR